MSTAGLAIYVVLGFLVPVPLLAWLDRPRRPKQPTPQPGPQPGPPK